VRVDVLLFVYPRERRKKLAPRRLGFKVRVSDFEVPLFFFEIRGGDTGREIRARRNKSSAAGEARSDANKISKMTMNIFRCLSYEHVNDKRSSRYSDSVFPSRAPAFVRACECARAHFPSFVFGCLVLLLFARARERERGKKERKGTRTDDDE